MGKGRKSVALFEVITAQQSKRSAEQIPKPGFWKRLGARRKPKLDIFRKAEPEPAGDPEAEKAERARRQAQLQKAAALKVAQERAAAREIKRKRIASRQAQKQKKRQQRESERAKRAEVRSVFQKSPSRKPKASAGSTRAEAPAQKSARSRTGMHRLRGIVRVRRGKLVISLDWLSGSMAAAGLLLVVGFAFGTGGLLGRAGGGNGANEAGLLPTIGREHLLQSSQGGESGPSERIRPGERPAEAFRFEMALNYIVVQTIGDRVEAEKCQRFLASHGIRAVIVPIPGRRGQRFEVVCTEGVTGVSAERCKQLAAKIRKIGKDYNAAPYRGGTDFSKLYLKKGTHYQSQ